MSGSTYFDAIHAIQDYYSFGGAGGDIWGKVYNGQKLTQAELNALKNVPGINYSVTKSGIVSGLSYSDPFSAAPSSAASINSNVPNAMYPSTASATSGKLRVPADYSIDTLSQNYKIDSGARKVSTGTRVASVAGKVTTAVAMVGAATWLGKTIDETLYNAGNFFGLHPPESLNPQTWSSLVSDFGPDAEDAFDALFGIEGDTATMYLPEDAMGYAYQYWLQQGAWDASGDEAEYSGSTSLGNLPTTAPLVSPSFHFVLQGTSLYYEFYYTGADHILVWQNANGSDLGVTAVSRSGPVTCHYRSSPSGAYASQVGSTAITLDSETPFYYNQYMTLTGSYFYNDWGHYGIPHVVTTNNNNPSTTAIGTLIYDGTITHTGIDGVSEDPEAGSHVNPTLIDASTPQTALRDLQQNYPQIFDGSITRGLPDSQGDVSERRYIPVPFPNLLNPTQPTTGSSHQQNPQVDPETSTPTETETTTDIMIGPMNPTPTPPSTPEPPDTGTGDTPTVVPVTGNASSLWAIYNPSQAQVDSFGAWLWSSNLVDQIKKLFSDPMQAIIGIHKVFATPSTGAAQTIKVGYLDSGVSSAVVTNQYTTVNCGTVSLREYYGNVMDYSPYTEVSLYLPFIGIVKLDTADVMRSSISVTYHVDVLTGACLADVKVTRDASGGVLYQYSGSAIVTYPVSSGSYVGAVAGVLGIAGGIAGTVLSGGALAPALLGGAMGASHLHANVQHSGAFSGAAGAMGGKKPYLIISRAQGATPNLSDIKGTPATKRVTLSSCSGYTVIDQVNLDGIPATSGELAEIESLLKQGVIV